MNKFLDTFMEGFHYHLFEMKVMYKIVMKYENQCLLNVVNAAGEFYL